VLLTVPSAGDTVAGNGKGVLKSYSHEYAALPRADNAKWAKVGKAAAIPKQ
jgi:hypothetical protein